MTSEGLSTTGPLKQAATKRPLTRAGRFLLPRADRPTQDTEVASRFPERFVNRLFFWSIATAPLNAGFNVGFDDATGRGLPAEVNDFDEGQCPDPLGPVRCRDPQSIALVPGRMA